MYVGSSKDLGNEATGRLLRYFRPSYLKSAHGKSMIRLALIKYGHNNFIIGILEYSNLEDLADRENLYLRQLNPEYNILKTAYSSTNYKHTPDSINKMSGPRPHYSPSLEQRLMLSIASKQRKTGKVFSEETKKKKSIPVLIYDEYSQNLQYSFKGVKEALLFLKRVISNITLYKYAGLCSPYKVRKGDAAGIRIIISLSPGVRGSA